MERIVNLDIENLVEPGVFEIMTGPSSQDADPEMTKMTLK